MKTHFALMSLLFLPQAVWGKTPTNDLLAQSLNPTKMGYALIEEADKRDIGYGDFSVAMEMILINAQGQKSIREMETKTLENPNLDAGDKSLIIFHKPRDIRGSTLLTHAHVEKDDDQWLYLPKIKMVKRISSANKSGPFMNSEFSYEDIVPAEITKYTYKYIGETSCDNGMDCIKIERIPNYKNSGYTKQILWLDKEELRIWKIDSYDKKKSKLKTMTVENYNLYLNKFWRPTLTLMKNHQTNKATELHWKPFQFKVGLNSNDFTKAKLKRTR